MNYTQFPSTVTGIMLTACSRKVLGKQKNKVKISRMRQAKKGEE